MAFDVDTKFIQIQQRELSNRQIQITRAYDIPNCQVHSLFGCEEILEKLNRIILATNSREPCVAVIRGIGALPLRIGKAIFIGHILDRRVIRNSRQEIFRIILPENDSHGRGLSEVDRKVAFVRNILSLLNTLWLLVFDNYMSLHHFKTFRTSSLKMVRVQFQLPHATPLQMFWRTMEMVVSRSFSFGNAK